MPSPIRVAVLLGALLVATLVAQEIPAGTVFPVMTNNSVDSRKSKPGDRISARLMQDVVLPSGDRIRRGATVDGQIVDATPPSAAAGARVTIRFSRVSLNGKQIPITVSLRALASMQDV